MKLAAPTVNLRRGNMRKQGPSPKELFERPSEVCPYCDKKREYDVLHDLQLEAVPKDALARSCCWKWICTVRGWHRDELDAETWRAICQARGYVRAMRGTLRLFNRFA
jgi:hypothetical protein